VLVGTHAEVLDGLTGVLGTAEQQGVATGRSAQGELVQGEGLTTGGQDASAGSGGEAESSNAQLGDLKETVVIGDGANNNNGLALLTLGLANNARDRDRGAVDTRHKEASEDDLVEGRLGTTSQEAVELHKELEVDIVALGGLAVRAAHVVTVEIDTFSKKAFVSFCSSMLLRTFIVHSRTRGAHGHGGKKQQEQARQQTSSKQMSLPSLH
jgi:hypothetical protein